MTKRYFILLIFCFFTSCFISCSKDGRYRKDDGHYGLHPAVAGSELYIYGGQKGNVFLGKLDASKYDTESIWNVYGSYGSKYNSKSIWNSYGTYGGKYGSYTPFNEYASYPPVLRNSKGQFCGYFTANKYMFNRADSKVADIICEHYDEIREDVSGWYEKIFR